MLTGCWPRKQNLTVYIIGGFEVHGALLKQLSPPAILDVHSAMRCHTTGCRANLRRCQR